MAAPPLEPWEQLEDPWEALPDDEFNWGGSGDEGDGAAPVPPRRPSVKEATAELGEYLITRVLLGKMTAKECCLICYWANLAGLEGIVASLAQKPDSPTGHFKRRFNDTLGISQFEGRTINLEIPGHSRSAMCRVTHKAYAFSCPLYDRGHFMGEPQTPPRTPPKQGPSSAIFNRVFFSSLNLSPPPKKDHTR